MRIHFYSISYSPEKAGSGRYNGELTEWLASQGHQVDVITAHPYYPEWRVHKAYRGKGWCTERHGNLTVYRCPLYVPKAVTGSSRILHELSFTLSSLVFWVGCLFRRYDLAIGMCPPLVVGLFPYLFSVLKRIPFLFHVQDLQVDAARELGMIRNKHLLNVLDRVEKFLLRRAAAVSSISEGMRQNIIAKGVHPDRYFMLPNWADTDFIRPLPPAESLRAELAIAATQKVILYSGNMGEKQGLEIILDAAEQLCHDPSFVFLLCGEGAARARLLKEAANRGIANVRFLPIRPYEDLPRILATGDVHLVILKKSTSDLVMPSKLVSILSAGGVPIVSAELGSTLHRLVTEHKVGLSTSPEDATELAATIRRAFSGEIDLTDLRRRSRKYAETSLSKAAILVQAESHLRRLCQK